jgi:ligand-binding sensor domain-containing protein
MGAAIAAVALALAFGANGLSTNLNATLRAATLWLERGQRFPRLALTAPGRSSLQVSGPRVERLEVRLTPVEERSLPAAAGVTGFAEDGETLWVGTFNDGLFETTGAGSRHQEAVDDRINDLASGDDGTLYVATNGGAFARVPNQPARRLAPGAFTSTAVWKGAPWFTSRKGLSTVDATGLWTRGPQQGFGFDSPSVLAACGERLCIGAMDGLWRFDGSQLIHDSSSNDALPTDWVTAVSDGPAGTWVGTFDSGLACLPAMGQGRRLTPAQGIGDGRIALHGLTQVGELTVAATPSGLVVVRANGAAHIEGPEVTAVLASKRGGVWLGHRGGATRVLLEVNPPQIVAEAK